VDRTLPPPVGRELSKRLDAVLQELKSKQKRTIDALLKR